MANKVIAICDFNNFKKQNAEALLFANILEKKYDSVAVLDLNDIDSNDYLKDLKWKQKSDMLSTNVFDISTYHFVDSQEYSLSKVLRYAQTLNEKNQVLIINTNFSKYSDNQDFYENADEIVIFTKLNQSMPNNLLGFFILNMIEKQKVKLFVFNDDKNIQTEKEFISLRKQLSKSNLTLENIKSLPYFKTLDEIKNIDPWIDIYKLINNLF